MELVLNIAYKKSPKTICFRTFLFIIIGYYFANVISSTMCFAPEYFSITHKT